MRTEGAFALSWRDARRDDRQRLQAFICTNPERAKWLKLRGVNHHPRPWELDAQSAVRKLKPPATKDERIRVAADGTGLAAVVHVARAAADDHGLVVPVVALAQRLRHSHTSLGAEVVTEALRAAAELRATSGMEGVGVFARIHPKNRASQRAFGAAGFECLGLYHLHEVMRGPLQPHQCNGCPETWVATL